jgi:uncharacterized membrane protein YgdD (TMEM256/DUF423 family)
MNRQIIITAAVLGMLGVIAGAFAAHGLKPKITPQNLEIWHTAVQYQFYHVFALLFLTTILWRLNESLTKLIYYLFTFGIIFFSGSLYLLATEDLLGLHISHVIGPITPLGGLFFIAGWATLALAAFRKN